MDKIEVGQIYVHYKNKRYRVLALAKDSNTLEDLVVYESLYANNVSKFWVRPVAEFMGKVEIDGKMTERFIRDTI